MNKFVAFFTRIAEYTIYPIIRWVQRFRRKRVVASILVVFAVVGSIYSYADGAYKFVTKALVAIGLDSASNRDRRVTLYRSYQLGKSVGQYITYNFRKANGEQSPLMDSQITSTAAMANSIATQLGFSLDIQKLHTQPVLGPPFWESSPGVRFIQQSVKTAKGEEAEIALGAGFHYSISEHRTNKGDYKPFEFMVTFPEEIGIGLKPAISRLGFPKYTNLKLKLGDGKAEEQVKQDNKYILLNSLFDWDRAVTKEFSN